MIRQRRHQLSDASSRLGMRSPRAALLHIRLRDGSRQRFASTAICSPPPGRRRARTCPSLLCERRLSSDAQFNYQVGWVGLMSLPHSVRSTHRSNELWGMRGGWHTRVPTRCGFNNSLRSCSYIAACVLIMRSCLGLINCFIAANAPCNRYERQSWLFQRPHGQQR
jgi:hypothetical protein